ncbi:hypothetical protein [Georgenia sp. H159]|uniref:hypothetical protein n=1 Tax=Georgenia sp. H159 TaxID=3076115 RepID=UPI002D77852E|nr:hypothetical protein [Georgenia sp. H159]
MTYRQHSTALAWHLATLVTTSSSRRLDAPTLGVALLARHESLRLVQEATTVATGRTPPARDLLASTAARTSLEDVVRDPVRAFERTILTYPTIKPSVVYTAIDPARLDETGHTWRLAARAAILARHDLAGEASTYAGDHRWGLLADAAALTPLLQRLDYQLLDSACLLDPDAGPTVKALSAARYSPASLLANEVDALAHAGQLPNLPILALPPTSTRPIQVDSPTTLLEAQRRLPAQLRATDIAPAVIAHTATGQAYLLDVAAGNLEAHHFAADAARTARQIGAELAARVRPEPRDVVALVPGDASAVMQTRAMTIYLGTDRSVGGADLVALRGLIQHAPTVIDALSRAADRQLLSGRWLTSAEGPELRWAPYGVMDDPPRIVAALRAVREQFPAAQAAARPRLDSARAVLATMRARAHDTRPESPAIAVRRARHHGPTIT